MAPEREHVRHDSNAHVTRASSASSRRASMDSMPARDVKNPSGRPSALRSANASRLGLAWPKSCRAPIGK